MPTDFTQERLEVTCESVDLARWLHEHTTEIALRLAVVHCATEFGNIDLIKWAYFHADANLYTVMGITRAMEECATLGRLEDLLWLCEHRPERCSRFVLSKAIASRQLQVVKWLLQNYSSGALNDPFRSCVDLEMSRWLVSEYNWKREHARVEWIGSSIETAAAIHAVDLVEFLYSIRPEANARMALSIAAGRGNLNMIKLLDRHKAKTTKKAMKNAIANGHLDVVEWLYQNRSE